MRNATHFYWRNRSRVMCVLVLHLPRSGGMFHKEEASLQVLHQMMKFQPWPTHNHTHTHKLNFNLFQNNYTNLAQSVTAFFVCILNTQILLLAQRHANPNACGELFLLLSTRPYASAVIALRTTLPAANISQLGRRTKKLVPPLLAYI